MIKAQQEQEDMGELITWDKSGRPLIPDCPILGFIEGDGTGPDIWAATRPVIDKAVSKVYEGKRKIFWKEVLAGEKALRAYGPKEIMPKESIEALKHYGIAMKGPLTTPVGGGFRSLNVTLRQRLDLYACYRPVIYLPGVPAPVRRPEKVNIAIFRENTEDVYAGLEWPAGSERAKHILRHINEMLIADNEKTISLDSAVGIKPMSAFNSKRLIRRAILFALETKRRSVTLVHKGNIMKFTEGAFRDWGYEIAREEFADQVITEDELNKKYGGLRPQGKIIINDRIADSMFQQLLLRPDEYDVIATPNLNGDYLSDAAAAQVGGLGQAPGANIGDACAVFEATHGSAPKYAGLDKVNPSSLLLSGVEMLRFMGWLKAAEIILAAVKKTISQGIVTYDLARQMEGVREVKGAEFSRAIQENIDII